MPVPAPTSFFHCDGGGDGDDVRGVGGGVGGGAGGCVDDAKGAADSGRALNGGGSVGKR